MNTQTQAITIVEVVREDPIFGLVFQIEGVEHSAYLDPITLKIDTDACAVPDISDELIEAVNEAFSTHAQVKPSQTLGKFKPLKDAVALTTKVLNKIIAAAQLHHDLQVRKVHPVGTFDSAGRFYLINKFACCAFIRSPSRSRPFSYMTHARTLTHVAQQCGLREHESLVRKFSKAISDDGLVGVYSLLQDRKYFAKKLRETQKTAASKNVLSGGRCEVFASLNPATAPLVLNVNQMYRRNFLAAFAEK